MNHCQNDSVYRFGPQRFGNQGWFRIGQFEVTTTTFIVGVATISLILTTIDPRTFYEPFYLDGFAVREGEVWRLITWPVTSWPDIWLVLSGAIFFLLGNQLEMDLGRRRMAWLYGFQTVIPALIGTAYAVADQGQNGGVANSGIHYLTTALLIIFTLRFPQARTFFGLPLWVLLAVFEGITALQLIATRSWPFLVFFLSTLAIAALNARAFDLTEFHQIPRIPLPGFVSGDPYAKANRARAKQQKKQRRSSGSSGGHGPFARKEPADVVPIRPQPRPEARLSREAQAELDGLLDKISDGGVDSLTPDERARLDALSRQLRGE